MSQERAARPAPSCPAVSGCVTICDRRTTGAGAATADTSGGPDASIVSGVVLTVIRAAGAGGVAYSSSGALATASCVGNVGRPRFMPPGWVTRSDSPAVSTISSTSLSAGSSSSVCSSTSSTSSTSSALTSPSDSPASSVDSSVSGSADGVLESADAAADWPSPANRWNRQRDAGKGDRSAQPAREQDGGGETVDAIPWWFSRAVRRLVAAMVTRSHYPRTGYRSPNMDGAGTAGKSC